MGITSIDGTVKGQSEKEISVTFLVDSGATYSLLPKDVCESLKLVPKKKLTFTLADGTTIERNISECFISLANEEGHTLVIMGEDDDKALLGVVTLEILGLVFNPFKRTLQPMRMLLM